MSTNRERADRAQTCLDCYRSVADVDTAADAVTDLVADIGHFCIENDLTYLWLLARGVAHWRLEMTDAESFGPLPEVTVHIHESTTHA